MTSIFRQPWYRDWLTYIMVLAAICATIWVASYLWSTRGQAVSLKIVGHSVGQGTQNLVMYV